MASRPSTMSGEQLLLSPMSAKQLVSTFRARGIPLEWDLDRFQSFLNDSNMGEPTVHSLSTEIHGRFRTATVSMLNRSLNTRISLPLKDQSHNAPVVLDTQFFGITTLSMPKPEDHKVDIIAIPGLNEHSFRSFKSRSESYMWLRDAIPCDIPMARVMTYGYPSDMIESSSVRTLDEIALSFYNELLQLANAKTMRPIILLAHCIGGLIIKKVLILLSKSQRETDRKLFRMVYGIVFFGVPHYGMDTTSLVPMVKQAQNQYPSNQSLIEFSHFCNAEVLGDLHRDFHVALGAQGQSEIVTFYETNRSPTPQQDDSGKWKMTGPSTVLVTKLSATQCRSWENGPEHVCAIERTHSDLIRFAPHDNEYEKVLERIKKLVEHALELDQRNKVTSYDRAMTIFDDQSGILLTEEEKENYPPAQPRSHVWRVQDVPQNFDEHRLANILRRHPKLQLSGNADLNNDSDEEDNGAIIGTLAKDLRPFSIATVSFRNLPSSLQSLGDRRQFILDTATPTRTSGRIAKRKRDHIQSQASKLVIDRHFNGITALYVPTADNHKMDIVALSGLGSHPFESFVHEEDGNMWLHNSLPNDMPGARTLIYGYQSRLRNGTGFANLGDLAGSFQIALSKILQSSNQKPIVLIGHSLGGLLIKEALMRISESDTDSHLIHRVKACLFFGVPNDGMEIESLIPMVTDQPTRSLVESLSGVKSQILGLQKRQFSQITDKYNIEMFCFYETEQSPTAWMDANGEYKMIGPLRYLVKSQSATSCLPEGVSKDHQVAIPRTHADLVKFSYRDFDYDKVALILQGIYERSIVSREHESPSLSPELPTPPEHADDESSIHDETPTRVPSRRRMC